MKSINYVKNNIWLSFLFVFCLFFIIYGSIYFFIDGISSVDDHFFHIKIARLLTTEGWGVIDNFNWYPVLDDRLDLSFFQICLIPFTYFSDLFTGLRVSDTFWAAMSLASIYFILRKFDFKYSFLTLIVILSSQYFFHRLFIGRGFVLTFGLLFFEFYFAQKKEYFKFFWISFFHILLHRSLLFFPPMIFFAVEISRYLVSKKFEWKGLFASMVAVVCGMFFYPNFPSNIFRWMRLLFDISFKTSNGLKLQGVELYPQNALDMISIYPVFSFVVIVSVALVVCFYLRSRQEQDLSRDHSEDLERIYALFLLLIIFIFGSVVISGRFFDYYLITAVILGAMILKFISYRKEFVIDRRISKYVLVACFVFFTYLGLGNYLNIMSQVAESDYKTIKGPIEWIRDNSEDQELVYLFNWSDFPVAFFYNDKNIYSWGIDPTTLINRDPKLYWKAYNIMAYRYYCEKPEDCEEDAELINKELEQASEEEREKIRKENSRKIINSIKNDFGSRFILSSNATFSERIKLNEDLIEDKFEAVSEKNKDYKVTAFKLK